MLGGETAWSPADGCLGERRCEKVRDLEVQVMVKLFASFRRERFRTELRSYPAATAIREIVHELGIPAQDLGIVLLNGVHACVDTWVEQGDHLSLLPRIGGG